MLYPTSSFDTGSSLFLPSEMYIPGVSQVPSMVGGAGGWAGVIQTGMQLAAPIIASQLAGGRNLPVPTGPTLPAPTGTPRSTGITGIPSITDILQGLRFGQGGLQPGLRLPGRRRRMNVTNPRALKRAMRRVSGFSKFARKSFILEKRVRMKRRRR